MPTGVGLIELDVDAHRDAVNVLLLLTSEQVRTTAWSADQSAGRTTKGARKSTAKRLENHPARSPGARARKGKGFPERRSAAQGVSGCGSHRRGAARGGPASGANLRGAYLIGADLRDADLRMADVIGADLRGADLSGANLGGSLFLLNRSSMRPAEIPRQLFRLN